MRKQVFTLLAITGLLLPLLTGCGEEERDHWQEPGPDVDSNELLLNWSVYGAEQVQTYAITPEPHECNIHEMYTLFFRASGHATEPDRYVGYTRSGVNSSGTTTGSSRVTLPVGENVNDAWQLVFIANLESYANLDGAVDVHSWLEDTLKPGGVGVTLALARPLLTGIANSSGGIRSLLPMSAEVFKAANVNVAQVTFTRRVARIDIIKDPAATNFVLESACIWNARAYAYLLDDGSLMTGTADADFVHYDSHVATTNSGEIKGALYAFPNNVMTPLANDKHTTCVIIGGRYTGLGASNTTTYYRLNVCPSGGSQNLKGNGAYTINIKSVTSDGKTDPGNAHNDEDVAMDYTITEWDDHLNAIYTYDQYGNGLAVSQRYVTFSADGGQYVDIEVFRIHNPAHPITGDWTVGTLSGTDSYEFKAEKSTGNPQRFFRITTRTDNDTSADRQATVEIQWGTIIVPVNITQVSPVSCLDGIQAIPSNLMIKTAGETREVCISLLGNFQGITRSDISVEITDNTGTGNWLQVTTGKTDEVNKGLFYYNFVVTPVTNGSRQANVRFTVTRGTHIATALVHVRQSWVDSSGSLIREVTVSMWEKDASATGGYKEMGNLLPIYTTMQGLPAGQKGNNHFHFPVVEQDQYKYRLLISSSMSWSIVTPGNTASGLDFTPQRTFTYAGDPSPVEVWVTAHDEVMYGWSGTFYIEFEDGTTMDFFAHQQGVFNMLNSVMYYYGTFVMNGKIWLDRNIGATVGMDLNDPTVGFYTSGTVPPGITNNAQARGTPMPIASARTSCPAGFRLPNRTAGSEWDWLYGKDIQSGALTWSGTTGNVAEGGISFPYVWYVTINQEPLQRFFLPLPPSYWGYSGEVITFNPTTGEKSVGTLNGNHYVRCVRQ